MFGDSLLQVINHAFVVIFALSIVGATWLIYRKFKAKAELLIAIGFTVLSVIRIGVLFSWDFLDDYSQEWTLITTTILAIAYWWLYFSSTKIKLNGKDKKDLQQFRKDRPEVDENKKELEQYRKDDVLRP